jgi:phosphonate transport system substrate-binding protein
MKHGLTRFVFAWSFMIFSCLAAVLCLPVERTVAAAENMPAKKSVLKIGFVPQDNAVRMVKKWQPMADYLSRELKRPVEIEIKPSYASVISDLNNGKVDLGLLGSFAYVRAAESGNIVPLVRRVIFGSSYYRGIIVVRTDSGIRTLAGLKAKRFAFTDRNSTTGYAFPVRHMKKSGLGSPEHFFSDVIFTGNHDSALLAVYSGSADGAALSTTRLDPLNTKLEQLSIIWKSESIPLGPFVARKELGPTLISKLRRAFLRINSSASTRPLLKQFGIDSFVPASDSEYGIVRALARSLGRIPEE